jgi:hypothetical protein
MAKATVSDGIDKALLAQIVAGTVTYVSQVQGQPMLAHIPPLIEVNTTMINPADPTQAMCRATPAAAEYLAKHETKAQKVADVAAHPYAIIKGVTLPEAKKRGNLAGSGAPTKYPFATMEVGDTFYSADTEHAKGDALKALGSTVSSQNRKNATPEKNADGTEKTKTVKRAERDKTTHKAVLGPDGKKVIESVTLPVLQYSKYFTIRAVEAGKLYGSWTAPANGAVIARTK